MIEILDIHLRYKFKSRYRVDKGFFLIDPFPVKERWVNKFFNDFYFDFDFEDFR